MVTHPGRQHSHQAALALEEAGMLAGYWAGVPAGLRHRRWVPAPLWRRFIRYAPVPLPEERTRWAPWVPALRRLADPLPRGAGSWADFLACRMFDRWAARRLRPGMADAVVACEISARETFRRAKRLGMTTVLDAAATHHATQDRYHGFAEPAELHRRITAIKDEEISLADHVLVVSELARRSYVEAGVPPERVHCVPLGADLELFAPAADEPSQAGATFVFAGAASRVKGLDVLLDAFAGVQAAEPGARLLVIGPPGDASPLLGPPAPAGGTVLGSLSQLKLAGRLRTADCLVLSSRNESFGMVVPEALASGVPALVSDRSGAADLIAEGRNGWVVPAGDAGALAARMLQCARGREELRRMRPACLESAAAADWSLYRRRLPALLRALLAGVTRP